MFQARVEFLLGTTSVLWALLGLTAVSWAAHLGYVHLDPTWLAFLGFAFTPYILSLMAIGELVNDKLPKTPSRLIPPQFIMSVVTGTLCGIVLGLSTRHLIAGTLAGVAGSVVGTLGGASARAFGATLSGRDLPAALIGGADPARTCWTTGRYRAACGFLASEDARWITGETILVRTWTTELKDRHIPVNILSPGAVETPIIDGNSFPGKLLMGLVNTSRRSRRLGVLDVQRRSPQLRSFLLTMRAATSQEFTFPSTAESRGISILIN